VPDLWLVYCVHENQRYLILQKYSIRKYPLVVRRGKKNTCCPVPSPGEQCRAVATISTDVRGQMVLLNDLLTKAGINPGVPSPKVSGERA
ncbi:MAG: hypothetical protein WC502_02110, partial [Methanolinea sp.]